MKTILTEEKSRGGRPRGFDREQARDGASAAELRTIVDTACAGLNGRAEAQ